MLKTVALLAIALVMKITLAIFVLTTPASSVCNVRLVRFLLRRHAYATNSKPGVIIARRYIVGIPMLSVEQVYNAQHLKMSRMIHVAFV